MAIQGRILFNRYLNYPIFYGPHNVCVKRQEMTQTELTPIKNLLADGKWSEDNPGVVNIKLI